MGSQFCHTFLKEILSFLTEIRYNSSGAGCGAQKQETDGRTRIESSVYGPPDTDRLEEKMKYQKLLSITRKAVDEFQMIEDGDRIAVGISGGKDSLTLLYALAGLRRFYPKKFELEAITVDMGFGDFHTEKIRELCQELQVPYTAVPTQISQIIFQDRKESNPCSLCAKMRKGALNEVAKEHGCNKIAYAHHKDDVVETLLLSLIYEGRFHTFSPVTYWDRMDLTLIRPLVFLDEADIIGFQNKHHLPVEKSSCPADGNTKREYVKHLLIQLNHDNPGVKQRMFTAVLNADLKGWPTRYSQKS